MLKAIVLSICAFLLHVTCHAAEEEKYSIRFSEIQRHPRHNDIGPMVGVSADQQVRVDHA
jgi:hypothetical protein